MITVVWGAATDTGQVRSLNEDCFLAEPPVFVVADGMGGHAAGEVASRLAVDEFKRLARFDNLTVDDVGSALSRANAAVLAEATLSPDRAGMGTTIAGLALVHAGGGQHWMIFNVGDSRVYRFADGRLDQVSVDHSEVEELVAAGEISRAQARIHPRRNIVTRSLGTTPAPIHDSWLLPPVPGERYLICSDGLPTEMGDEEICSHMSTGREASEIAHRLVERAVELGGRDNVTVVVIDVLNGAMTSVDEDTTPRGRVVAMEGATDEAGTHDSVAGGTNDD